MVSERNRILDIKKYLEKFGLEVNIKKNTARGNKGFFVVKDGKYRIDISNKCSDTDLERTLAHEFAHFVHYSYDKTLQDLDFIFSDFNDELNEELILLTLETISKKSISPLFEKKDRLNIEIKDILSALQNEYSDIKLTQSHKKLESKIRKLGLSPLLRYDRVRIYNGLTSTLLSISELKDMDLNVELYFRLKSKQRELKRISSRISKLNKYYNSKTELFARAFELYIADKDKVKNIAPVVYSK